MSQHDLNIANAIGASVRADINNALVALASGQKGPTAPSNHPDGSIWIDDSVTGEWTVKIWDGSNWRRLYSITPSDLPQVHRGFENLVDGASGYINFTSGATSWELAIPPCRNLKLIFDLAGHSSGTSQHMQLELSSNNGSTWGTAFQLGNDLGSGAKLQGFCDVFNTDVNGANKIIVPNCANTGLVVAYHETGVESSVTGIIDRIRLSFSGGANGDEGKCHPFGYR